MPDEASSRWTGRNGAKAAVRNRIWSSLVESGVNVGPAFDRIPNFVGADVAAKRLGELDAWKRARVVKCNPDPPQIPVRLRALYDGKLLFSPVPYLTKDFPYLRIDPEKLAAKGVDFETAAQVSRLNEALIISYDAMVDPEIGANFKAIDSVVKIVREMDRYHGFVERRGPEPYPRRLAAPAERRLALAPQAADRIAPGNSAATD